MNETHQQETVNETIQPQSINRFLKMSKQEKAILEWLKLETGFLDIHRRTSKHIAFHLLEQKYGKAPVRIDEWHERLQITKEQFEALDETEKRRWGELYRYAHGAGRFIHADSRLPHFLAQLKIGDPLEVDVDDVYDFAEGPSHFTHMTKKDLLREANTLRASVCRSLKRLMKRGLLVSLTITKCTSQLTLRRVRTMEKTYYFLTKEQGQKIIDADRLAVWEGQWQFREPSA